MIGPFQTETVGYTFVAALALIGLMAIIATIRRSPKTRAIGCLAFVSGLLVLACCIFFAAGEVEGNVSTRGYAMSKGVDPQKLVDDLHPTVEMAGLSIPATFVLLIGAVTWPIGWRRERAARMAV